MIRFQELLKFDHDILSGYRKKKVLCGIDEVGRGPVAGPVVACALILPLDKISRFKGKVLYIRDSKKISEKLRFELYDLIKGIAVDYSFGIVDNHIIDQINILNATKKAMNEALKKIRIKPDIVLIDYVKLHTEIPTISVKFGDSMSLSIAASSIMAKVYRDRIMYKLDEKYPQYNFRSNKGYGTKQHIKALREQGICEIHRKTFAPVKDCLKIQS